MVIKSKVYDDIIALMSGVIYEQGGIIGCSESGVISDYIHDSGSPHKSVCTYTPDADYLNNEMSARWSESNIKLCGFVHTHFINGDISEDDISYAREVISNFDDIDSFIMGIIVLDHTACFMDFKWYKVDMNQVYEINVGIV